MVTQEEDPWAGTDALADFAPPPDISIDGEPGKAFYRTDLARMAREGISPPRLICEDLLYRGQMHSLSGPPDCGKSTFVCWTALQVIRSGGEYVLMDEESGPAQYVSKLIDLGAKPDELEHLHYFGFPGRTWDDEDTAALAQLMENVRPAMVAWDSAGAFLARAGLDENNAPDVTKWLIRVLQPASRLFDSAVLVTDHDVKSSGNTRYARGSGAKLAAVDVQFKMTVLTPFSRSAAGKVKLIVSKDRSGYLHRWHKINVTPGMPLRFEVEGTDAVDTSELTEVQTVLLSILPGGDSPQTLQWITDKLSRRTGVTHHRQVVSRCLNELSDMRLADRMDMGTGMPAYWYST